MPEPVAPAPGPATRKTRRRAPFGVSAVAVALAASLPIWAFDWLEGVLDVLAPGGAVILAIIGAYGFVWFAVGGAILALFSPRPDQEGLLAGALVVLVMLAILVWDMGLEGQTVALVWFLFGCLTMGCGAVAGLIGASLQRGRTRSAGRAAAIVAIACAVAIALSAQMLFGGLSGALAWFIVVLVLALAGTGAWWLLQLRKAGTPP